MPVRDDDGLLHALRRRRDRRGDRPDLRRRRRAGARFEGYTDPAETERKILRDVFAPGDAWFRTGDLMRRDEQGYYYFVDRIGDTFRWKGENVATSEVAAAITAFPGVIEANVYGVAVPGADGRAGMAELVCAGPIDLAAFREHLAQRLPELCPAGVPAHPRHNRGDGDVQADEEQSWPGGLRSRHVPRSALRPRPANAAYAALDDALYKRVTEGRLRL